MNTLFAKAYMVLIALLKFIEVYSNILITNLTKLKSRSLKVLQARGLFINDFIQVQPNCDIWG